MILVDTSAWVHAINKKGFETHQLEQVVTCPPIIQGVLEGVSQPQTFETLKRGLLALPCVSNPVKLDLFLEASELMRVMRTKEVYISSPIDCLVAIIAMENRLPVLHRSENFDRLARFTQMLVVKQFN